MPKDIIVEGQTATNPQTQEKIIYRGGKWYPINDPSAQPTTGKNATMSADARVRVAAGLGPAIEAQKNLYSTEQWNQSPQKPNGHNPLNAFGPGLATMIAGDESPGPIRNALAKQIGGQSYQDYTQAAKTFESAFLPILSGASVTASEAQRMIRASLPQMGDSPETLAKKAKNRAMMINGMAELMGNPPPFPRTQSMTFGPQKGVGAQAPQPPAQPAAKMAGDGWKIVE
jgi:hypothetical protein